MKIEHKAWLGKYSVTFNFDTSALHEGMHCSWEPDVPEPSSLTRKEQRRYLRARHKFFADIAKAVGTQVMVVDL